MGARTTLAVLGTAVSVAAVLVGDATEAQATAPGENGRIVFRRYLDVERNTGAIFTVNANGTDVRRVTRPRFGVLDTEPDWSPDGTRIAFQRQVACPAGGPRDGLDNTCDLVYIVNRNGKGLRRLAPCGFDVGTAFPGNCVGVHQPAWSPDGTKLAFRYSLVDQRYVNSLRVNAGIWIVNADGTGLRQVTQWTPGSAWDAGPQWSPDGSKLVFYRVDFGREADAVFTVNVDGSGEFQVTPWELGAGDAPDWSPDGQWLLFRAEPTDGSSNVYKSHPDGSGLTNLTRQTRAGAPTRSRETEGRIVARCLSRREVSRTVDRCEVYSAPVHTPRPGVGIHHGGGVRRRSRTSPALPRRSRSRNIAPGASFWVSAPLSC